MALFITSSSSTLQFSPLSDIFFFQTSVLKANKMNALPITLSTIVFL